jgi:hypothetical protein
MTIDALRQALADVTQERNEAYAALLLILRYGVTLSAVDYAAIVNVIDRAKAVRAGGTHA